MIRLNVENLNVSDKAEYEIGYVNVALFGLDSREKYDKPTNLVTPYVMFSLSHIKKYSIIIKVFDRPP